MAKIKDYTTIELLFPSELFLKGEELFESGAVTNIQKLEKNLFGFTVREGGNFEVEWLKPLTKNQKATCECGFFKIGKICKHAIAALLAYKAEFQKEVGTDDTKEGNTRVASLSINNILAHLTKEDLKQFVKSYSITDKKFATAIKVHFARKVDVHDNEKKYKNILDSIIRPISSNNHTFKAAEIRQLLQVTDEFLDQADDALALGQPYEALLLVKNSLLKLCYVYHNSSVYENDYQAAILKAHQRLIDICNSELSIDVQNEIAEFFIECAQLSYYPYLDLKCNVISIADRCSKPIVEVDAIIEDQMKRKQANEEQLTVLLALYYIQKSITKGEMEIEKRHLPYIDKIAKTFYTAEYDKYLADFCTQNLSIGTESHLFHIQSLVKKEDKSLAKAAAMYFLEKKDLRIVDLLKMHDNSKVMDAFRKLVASKIKVKTIHPQTLMQYMAKTEAYNELLQFLIKQRDFRYLMQYDAVLMKDYEPELTNLYLDLTEQFLHTYIGLQSQSFIDELFSHLNKINAGKIVNKIAMMIEMKFPHKSALDELVK